MNFLGNIIWLIFGGIIIAIEYLVGSIILMMTIIGIPFGLQTLKMASLAFGHLAGIHEYRPRSSGCLYIFMNVLWLLTGGLWIAITHAIFGLNPLHYDYRYTIWTAAL